MATACASSDLPLSTPRFGDRGAHRSRRSGVSLRASIGTTSRHQGRQPEAVVTTHFAARDWERGSASNIFDGSERAAKAARSLGRRGRIDRFPLSALHDLVADVAALGERHRRAVRYEQQIHDNRHAVHVCQRPPSEPPSFGYQRSSVQRHINNYRALEPLSRATRPAEPFTWRAHFLPRPAGELGSCRCPVTLGAGPRANGSDSLGPLTFQRAIEATVRAAPKKRPLAYPTAGRP